MWLLFLCIQFFIATVNAQHLSFQDPLAMMATVTFQVLGCFLGPILVHFHLIFPRPIKIISRYKRFPLLFYMIGSLLTAGLSASYIYDWSTGSFFSPVFNVFNRIVLWWLTMSFIQALARQWSSYSWR